MGFEINIGSSFWKWYFHNEEDARKINIFDLINASITVASFKKPDEFRSKRLWIMESLFTNDSKAKMGSRLIVKVPSKINQEPIMIQGCKDQACKDEIFSRHKKFDDLERELDEFAQPVGFHNVNVPDNKRKAEVSKICRSGTMFKADKKRKEIPSPPSLGHDGKPKQWFGSHMKKIRKARF
ncbi:Hypothetical predicted protein [Olea europaea subsp. europaea]|uniref:Uncharacterized protein n=1 Tax=Olea europaea subsp. europaea TaxID=158383 RepID=A0A8S0VHR6_OLEEU|nr:Hypothetical predicted protein [Olea europaea subsp. europaea]